MKINSSIAILAIAFVGCAEDNPAPVTSTALPRRHVYFNFETGQQIAVKTLTYNNEGKLVLEDYVGDPSFGTDYTIHYKYDTDNNLVEDNIIQKDVSGSSTFTNIYTYEQGLKRSEYSVLNGNITGYRKEYFYTGAVADSVQEFAYSTVDAKYNYLRTEKYEYDEFGKLVNAVSAGGLVITAYEYSSDQLLSTCTNYDGLNICTKNTYNVQGHLASIRYDSPAVNQLTEERFYAGDLLKERKLYTYPAYDPGNLVDVTLIKYEY